MLTLKDIIHWEIEHGESYIDYHEYSEAQVEEVFKRMGVPYGDADLMDLYSHIDCENPDGTTNYIIEETLLEVLNGN